MEKLEFARTILFLGILCCIQFNAAEATASLHFQEYIEAALKETLTFNISWVTEENVTLTIAQVIGTLDTGVLSVNGTYVELLNNWFLKGTAEIFNETDNTYTMTLTLANVALEDEGYYEIHLDAPSYPMTTFFFIIQTYAAPINLRMTSDATNYTELTNAVFTCSGNVGRPLGNLRLLRSSNHSNSEYVSVEKFISSSELEKALPPESFLANGTHQVTYTFYRNVTRQDNGMFFMCDVEQNIPTKSSTRSNQVAVFVEFEGITISIDPTNSVTLYKTVSVAEQFRTFTCRGGIQGNPADMQQVRLSITRLTRHELKAGETTPQVIAIVLEDQGAQRPDVMDIQDRNRVPDDGIAGSVNKVDYRQSDLSIKFNTVAMKCDDAGQYFCNLNYLDKNFNTMPPETSSENLTVSAIPDRVDLTGQPDIRRSGDGSINFPYEMKVGDVIEFDCNGRIGGDPNVQWEWKKTAESGALIKLVPSSSMYIGRVNETRGPAIPVENECTNTRKTTLRYTITTNDQNVKGDIQFQCFVDSQGANVSSRFVYVRVEGGAPINEGGTGGSSDPETSNAGLIAGVVVAAVVFIVIVVLLIYFLWYRRRGGGDTYKTREETDGSNPNLAPSAADLYAQPNKDRNPEPPKPKPRPKKGKELHYAELDIATNVPRANPRKSHDRVEYAEVKFNNNHDYEHPV